MDKVFCIGLPKTGTTSMGVAFEMLGYKHNKYTNCHLSLVDIVRGNGYIKSQLEQYDAFEDTPYHLIYKRLADQYPDAKFILTERNDPYTYLQSLLKEPVKKINSKVHKEKKKFIFGVRYVRGNEQMIMDYYLKHNQDVKDYFDDLLVVNIDRVNSMQPLCEFLGKEIIYKRLPHKNKS